MVYVYTLGSILVLAVGYNLLLRYFTKPIIWLGIVGTGAGIISLGAFLQEYHYDHFVKVEPESENVGYVLITFVCLLYLVAFVYILLILCIYKSIAVSVTVLKTAAVIITKNL